MNKQTFNFDEIRHWYGVFKTDGQLVEIRAKGENGRIFSGYFTDPEKLITQLGYMADVNPDFGGCTAIWFTLNTINPALYSREQRDKFIKTDTNTKDSDITHRDWLLIDVDPERPAGISSTDAELQHANDVAVEIFNWLRSNGWTEPIVAQSGNGYHLLYKIDAPNNNQTTKTLQRLLERMKTKWIEVDGKNFNAARVCKLYGTKARKGSETPERPHRMAMIVSEPSQIDVVTTDTIIATIDQLPLTDKEQAERERQQQRAAQPTQRKYNTTSEPFNLEQWLVDYNVEYRKIIESDGTKYELKNCPFCENPTDWTSAVFQSTNGVITFNCFHDHCKTGATWSDFRLHYEPNYNPNAWMERQQQRQQYNNNNQLNQQSKYDPNTDHELIKHDALADAWSQLFVDDSKNIIMDYGFYNYDGTRVPLKLRAKAITYFAGATSHGKSTMLENVAVELLTKGKRVLYYGFEDPRVDTIVDMINIYVHRMTGNNIARLSEDCNNVDAINNYFQKRNEGNDQTTAAVVFDKLDSIGQQNIAKHIDDFLTQYCGYGGEKMLFLYDEPMSSVQLVSHIGDRKNDIKPDAIFIDYIQFLKSRDNGDGATWELLGEVSKDIITIAKNADVPIIAAAQVNEKTRNGALKPDTITRNDIEGGSAIAQGAAQVVLCMNSKFIPDDVTIKYTHGREYKFGKTGMMMLKLDKNRRGESPAIGIYKYNGDCRFINPLTIQNPEKIGTDEFVLEPVDDLKKFEQHQQQAVNTAISKNKNKYKGF